MLTRSEKTKGLIQAHAFKFQKDLEREIKRTASLMTRDWRMVVAQEQAENNQVSKAQKLRPENRKIYWDRAQVLREVMVKAEVLISGLLSEEINNKRSTPSKTVWGKKHGSVTLHRSGPKEGLVNDYERGLHGDVITYYAKHRGIDWYDAMSELAGMVGLDPERGSIQRVVTPAEEKLKAERALKKEQALLEEEKRRTRLQQVAQKIWKESQPIQGTLAERYLKEHRGMDFDLSKLEMRYHSAAPDFTGSRSTKPAMVVGFFNSQKELTSVQCTYLDPRTANKDKTLEVGKRTIGQLRGSAGLIYQGGDEKVVVAEGAETAASLIPAVKAGSIYISGGNMQNVGHLGFLADQHETKEIHIAADNDLSFEVPSWKATEAGARKLDSEGVKPLVVLPEVVDGKKTDFNDVLKKHGSEEVIKQFQPKFEMVRDEFSIGDLRLTEIQGKEMDLYKNKSSMELMGRLFELEQNHLKTTIDKFNKLNDKDGQKVLDGQLKDIAQEQSVLITEIKNNPARWADLSEKADQPMLAGMKLSEIQAALKQGNLSRKVIGEALDRVGKIERRIGSGDSHGRAMGRGRGRSQ